MISITAIALILLAHWVGDFLLQSNKMAMEKGQDNLWLSLHVLSYSSVILAVALLLFGSLFLAIQWTLINAALHWVTDYNTSRLNARLKKESVHYFFVGIGFDQMIHYLCLFGTYTLLT